MGITFLNNATAIAEKYLGDIERYREVYKDNPSLLSYRLPPAAQAGIDILAKNGIKLPSVAQLNKKLESVDGELGKAVGNLFRDSSDKVTKSGAETKAKDGLKLIKSLDWLL